MKNLFRPYHLINQFRYFVYNHRRGYELILCVLIILCWAEITWQTGILELYPSTDHLSKFHSWSVPAIGLAGFLLSLLLTIFIVFLHTHQTMLERQVNEWKNKAGEQQEDLAITLQSIGAAVITTNCSGCITHMNPAAEILTGWNQREAEGKLFSETIKFIDSETRLPVDCPVEKTLRTGCIAKMTDNVLFVSVMDKETQIAYSTAPIRFDNGNVRGAVIEFHDVTEQYEIKESLRKSNERFDQIAELSREMVWEVDTEGLYTYVSNVSETILGYKPEELTGKKYFYDVHLHAKSPDNDSEITTFEAFLNKEFFSSFINRAQTKDGRLVWLSTNGLPIIDKAGNLVGYRGSNCDITGRMQKEEQIRLNEFRLGILFRIFHYNADNVQTLLSYALDEALKMTGSKVGYIFYYNEDTQVLTLNTWSKNVMKECDVSETKIVYPLEETGLWGEVIRQRKPVILNNYQAENPVKKGYPAGHIEITRFLSIPVFIDQRIAAVVGVANKEYDYDETDILQFSLLMNGVWKIVERKQAEESLRKLSRAVEQSPASIVITDTEGAIEYVNPKFTELTGYSFEEAIGKKPNILKSEEIPPDRYKDLWETIKEGHVWMGEFCNKKKNGELYWEIASISPVINEVGIITNFIAVKEDVTERKLAEEALRQSKIEIEKANKQLENSIILANEMTQKAEMANLIKSQFLANMSHEIRTPMNGVIGMTGLLLDTDLTTEQRKFTEIARTSAESLLSLINDILDFSKIEANKMELEILDFDLLVTLEDVTEMLAMKAHEKGLELTCIVDPEIPIFLQGDPGRLRQIVLNLATNALKFTQKGEMSIQVNCEKEDADKVVLLFKVQDTGIGIPANRLNMLFSPFTQVDGSTTRKFGGTGLGLAISKQLALLMGGEIGVESKEGAGSLFWFTAGFTKQPESQQKLFTDKQHDLSNLHVLVVDDNETNRFLVTTLLKSWGCRYDEARNGPAALEQLFIAVQKEDPFQLALLDLQMPDMTGEELGTIIKKNEFLHDTRLVMLTSLGKRGDASRFKKSGFSAYLMKPIRQRQLHECISIVMGISRESEQKQSIITPHTITENERHNIRILLAEDNPTNQTVAMTILSRFGFRADAVGNGKEAVEILSHVPYDLVLMDCNMPEVDGYEATQIIRDINSTVLNHQIPVIALTANAMKGDREKCLQAGMNDYISKPISPENLITSISRWISGNTIPNPEPILQIKPELSSAIFDRAGFMERIFDDTELACEIIRSFFRDLDGLVKQLYEHLSAADGEKSRKAAHGIKGAAGTVGAMVLRSAALEVETFCKQNNVENAIQSMIKLEEEILSFKKEVREFLE